MGRAGGWLGIALPIGKRQRSSGVASHGLAPLGSDGWSASWPGDGWRLAWPPVLVACAQVQGLLRTVRPRLKQPLTYSSSADCRQLFQKSACIAV